MSRLLLFLSLFILYAYKRENNLPIILILKLLTSFMGPKVITSLHIPFHLLICFELLSIIHPRLQDWSCARVLEIFLSQSIHGFLQRRPRLNNISIYTHRFLKFIYLCKIFFMKYLTWIRFLHTLIKLTSHKQFNFVSVF